MTTKSNKTSEAVPKLAELLQEILPIAAKFKKNFTTAKELIGENKQQILKLREAFGVSQGQSGKKLDVEGNTIYWSEFVETYFGCSQRWMNEQLGVKKDSAPGEKKRDQESPLWKKGFSAGRESVTNAEEIQAQIKEGVNKKYERQIFELEKKGKHRTMLVKLLDEIEKVGDKVPVTLTQTAKKMREELEKKDVVAETQKAIDNADLTSVVEKLNKPSWECGYIVARIGDSAEFGLFTSKAHYPFTREQALAIGTKAKMEEELKSRVDAKKPEQVESAQAANA